MSGIPIVPGDVVWRLYDTYGFPYDLTSLICEERGLKIDFDGYEEAKKRAQLLSQGKESNSVDSINFDVHAITELQNSAIPITDDSPKYAYDSQNQGDVLEYVYGQCEAEIVAIR